MNQLAQQTQRSVHLDREQMSLGGGKNGRQPDARDVVGYHDQPGHRLSCPLHATHATEVF
jgi:hypothetical protein